MLRPFDVAGMINSNRSPRRDPWGQIAWLRRQRRFQTAMTLGLVFLGPVLVIATILTLGPMSRSGGSTALRLILLADFIYVLVVAALVLARVLKMVTDRRRKSAGSRLHLRLAGVFAAVALVPTILVAIFAVLSINLGLESWFSERVRNVVGSSLAAAEAYDFEQRQDLLQDIKALSDILNQANQQNFLLRDDHLRPLLADGQEAIQRGLKEAYLVDGAGDLRTRGYKSYLFGFENLSEADLSAARSGQVVFISDWPNNELRALIHLNSFPDRYLYVSREVDGRLLSLLDETKETVHLYGQLEADRGKLLLNFALIYLGFALIIILATTWLGLWLAQRLARPVEHLVSAASRVGAGDLEVRVAEEKGDDEIALLGKVFNGMTRELKQQREVLIETHMQTEQRRRQFDTVLSNISAGVIGLDSSGQLDFMNRAAVRMLELCAPMHGQALEAVVPEFSSLFHSLQGEQNPFAQEELRVTRRGHLITLLVRMSERRNEDDDLEGYVISFDDVTDLVSAQRLAAWGDVARRIAHEIKNPLTPIALSAERLKRKFISQVQEPQTLESLTDVIVRQTNDLRRIVDEFSKFARMPEPDRRETDLIKILQDAITLQKSGQPTVEFEVDLPDAPIVMDLDATMISQAFINLLKNAGEATETYIEKGAPDHYQPRVRVEVTSDEQETLIRISDNGIGLPQDRTRLFEPYVTTRAKGTGLGLPIVKKIIEEHGGSLALLDETCFNNQSHTGALAEIRLPRLAKRRMGRNISPVGQGG